MNARNIFIAAVASFGLITAVGFSADAMARGHGMMGGGAGYHMMHDSGYAQLTPEKQAQADAILNEFRTKTAPLHDKMWAKHTELNALSANSKTEPKDISRLTNELVDLRAQLRKEGEALDARLLKDVGLKTFYGTMPMHGGMGGMGGKCGGMGSMNMKHGGGYGPHNGQHSGARAVQPAAAAI